LKIKNRPFAISYKIKFGVIYLASLIYIPPLFIFKETKKKGASHTCIIPTFASKENLRKDQFSAP
jgi:hypothetical protein